MLDLLTFTMLCLAIMNDWFRFILSSLVKGDKGGMRKTTNFLFGRKGLMSFSARKGISHA
jgi:hypothetical protein